MARSREEYNAYMAKYMKDWYDRRHAYAIEKLGGKCVKCGSTDRLEIDHIDRTTVDRRMRRGRGNMWTASEERFQAELAKCQLLCHEHHLEKTKSEFSVPHGGGVSGKKNCPCVPCKQKKAEYMASYHLTRKNQGDDNGSTLSEM